MITVLPEADVFMSTPGSVLVLSKTYKSKFYAVLSPTFDYQNARCIITGLSVAESTNHQFMSSLNSYVYLYTFGDKISEVDVTGVMFLNSECDGRTGPFGAYTFFEANKISKGATLSVTMTAIGSTGGFESLTFSPCFLTNMTLSINDSSSMLGNFAFKMHFMPNV